jgi:putative ABC transport system substrate-binding protein
LAIVSTAVAGTDPERVAVLITGREAYREGAAALAERIRAAGHSCELIELPAGDTAAQTKALQRLATFEPAIVAAGGATATEQALATVPGVPVVFFTVPHGLDVAVLREDHPDRDRIAGVTSDIAFAEQVLWIKQTAPHCRNVGLLCSARTRRTAEALQAAGRKRGLRITPIPASCDAFPQAVDTLNANQCDGVLMIPDAEVYNAPNIRRLLLWGVRRKKPVWAFSASIVKAGALAGLYCDHRSMGTEAAQIVLEIIGGKPPTAIGVRHPQEFGRAINVHTAKTIGVQFEEQVFASGAVKFGEPR